MAAVDFFHLMQRLLRDLALAHIVIVCPLLNNAAHAQQCPPLTPAGLAALIRSEREDNIEVFFFSSWCSDCAAHLKTLKESKTILIGAFDTRQRVEKVLQKIGLKNRCFIDSGITKRLAITIVPKSHRFSHADAEQLLQ